MRRIVQLRAALVKETLALLRDVEALLILIVMPAVFVLIMSLALQNTFAQKMPKPLHVVFLDQAHGTFAAQFAHALKQSPSLRVTQDTTGGAAARGRAREAARTGKAALALVATRARGRGAHGLPILITLYVNPALPGQVRVLAVAAVRQAMARVRLLRLQSALARLPKMAPKGLAAQLEAARLVVSRQGLNGAPTPTSVQQNAPAWALLAMFFLTVPLSVSVIKERQQGVLLRLRALPVPSWVLLAGKIVPYFVVNMIQLVIVLMEGKYVLPLLGGDALSIGHAPFALGVVAASANVAAIGYGLLVATFVRTHEQATSFGAVSVLIMAAIGGILVPKMVMPVVMQRLTVVSPMSWGLEGFEGIFVRGDHLAGVLPDAWRLLVFGGLCLLIAALRFRHELRPH